MFVKSGDCSQTRGVWRVCIDLTDLNKSIPKKPYPPVLISSLILWQDMSFFRFFDIYKGYDQIPMAKEDIAKIAFITDDGI